MILSGLDHSKVEHILRNLKQSLSLEEQTNFGEVLSWDSQQNSQNKKTIPSSLQPRNFSLSLKNFLIGVGLALCLCLCFLFFILNESFFVFLLIPFITFTMIFTSILAIPFITIILMVPFSLKYFISLPKFNPEKNYNITLLLTFSSFITYLVTYLFLLYYLDTMNRVFSSELFSILFLIVSFCLFFVIHILSLIYSFRCRNLTLFQTFCIYGSIILNILLPLIFLPILYFAFFFQGF